MLTVSQDPGLGEGSDLTILGLCCLVISCPLPLSMASCDPIPSPWLPPGRTVSCEGSVGPNQCRTPSPAPPASQQLLSCLSSPGGGGPFFFLAPPYSLLPKPHTGPQAVESVSRPVQIKASADGPTPRSEEGPRNVRYIGNTGPPEASSRGSLH